MSSPKELRKQIVDLQQEVEVLITTIKRQNKRLLRQAHKDLLEVRSKEENPSVKTTPLLEEGANE
jgi:hypothetical protein